MEFSKEIKNNEIDNKFEPPLHKHFAFQNKLIYCCAVTIISSNMTWPTHWGTGILTKIPGLNFSEGGGIFIEMLSYATT